VSAFIRKQQVLDSLKKQKACPKDTLFLFHSPLSIAIIMNKLIYALSMFLHTGTAQLVSLLFFTRLFFEGGGSLG